MTDRIDEELYRVQIDDVQQSIKINGAELRIVEASEPMQLTGASTQVDEKINLSLDAGIHVIFKSNDHHLINKKYQIFLSNATDQTYVYEYQFALGQTVIHTESNRITPYQSLKLGSMMYEDLNEKAIIHLTIAPLTTAGLDPWKKRSLHLKMKQFFKKQEVGLADGCLYHDYLMTGWQTVIDPKDQKPLEVKTTDNPNKSIKQRHQVISAANFDTALDLHIEKLTANHEGLSNYQILTIQMESMKRYIDKAKTLRMDSVFLIHGLGKGRLKRDIAHYLDRDPDVLFHKNEYHPKYGFGATEVVFR